MSDYLVSGLPPGAGGVGRFLKRLIPEARRAGWGIMCRPERPARGIALHALKLLAFYVRIITVRNRDVIVIHPQTLRWGTFFRLCRANRVALLVVDNSFFCIRSYNYRGQRWSECLDCLGNISECHPDCMPFPVSYRRQDNLEYLERLKMLAPKIRFLVQNPGQGRLIKDHFGLDVDIRQVGMVTDEFMVEPLAATGTSGVDIVFHGNLNRPKGFEYALELARNLPDLSFLFPGDPGMMPVENIQIQLVDTPPLSRDYIEPEMMDMIRRCDLVLLMVDLQTDPLQQLEDTVAMLDEHRIVPLRLKDRYTDHSGISLIPFLVMANKNDDETTEENLDIFCELLGDNWPMVSTSIATGRNIELLKKTIVERLNIIRVYAKSPGKKSDRASPFVLKKGSTMADFAGKIHQDFARKLKSAKVWGTTVFDGQMVQRDYVLQDGDIVELQI
jgi:hypothetical protein